MKFTKKMKQTDSIQLLNDPSLRTTVWDKAAHRIHVRTSAMNDYVVNFDVQELGNENLVVPPSCPKYFCCVCINSVPKKIGMIGLQCKFIQL